MAGNKIIYVTNPTKPPRLLGLNDTIRYNTYAYATLYTVLSTETLILRNGFIGIDYVNGANANVIQVNLTIGTIKYSLYRERAGVDATEAIRFSLNDKDLGNILLSTGDTIKIEFIHSDAALLPTGNITASLYFEDYTA